MDSNNNLECLGLIKWMRAATQRDSVPFLIVRNKDLCEKTSFISDFSLTKDRRQEWLSRVRSRYIKVFRECKDIEDDF